MKLMTGSSTHTTVKPFGYCQIHQISKTGLLEATVLLSYCCGLIP